MLRTSNRHVVHGAIAFLLFDHPSRRIYAVAVSCHDATLLAGLVQGLRERNLHIEKVKILHYDPQDHRCSDLVTATRRK